MTAELKVHPSFFREFATKTWVTPHEIVKELIENAFDEDATQVIVTILANGSIIIEDNAGMDRNGMEKFLLLGSPHKAQESISPKLKRIRTGRYGTGRLSFLTSFEQMKIRTKRDNFSLCVMIDAKTLDNLFSGRAELETITDPLLGRNGSELTLMGPKIIVDVNRLSKEIRKLAILRHPMFEVSIKSADTFIEWDTRGSQLIKPPDIQGHRIPVSLDDGKVTGEIVIARRPLSEDEKAIAILVGNHIVTRSNFGFDAKFSRVTGLIRANSLTSRFADKSALIEDEEYVKFNRLMKSFIADTVVPSLTEYEDVLITREESRIYKEIDKVLGQAIIENVETEEEVQSYETIDVQTQVTSLPNSTTVGERVSVGTVSSEEAHLDIKPNLESNLDEDGNNMTSSAESKKSNLSLDYSQRDQKNLSHPETSAQLIEQITLQPQGGREQNNTNLSPTLQRRVKKPVIKKTFALKKIGYKVIPYEDESDSRYSFTSENVVFVNKANSTYRAEASRGDEFLLRHIIGIVAETIAETKHPEGKEALELQNRLVAEAIRIHDYSVIKRT
jgi:Histidine kinase-, DNA gyrase B-, and HSP90-like ATPase